MRCIPSFACSPRSSPRTRPASRRSRAYTLVEMLVVISLLTVMLSMVAITLHLLQRINHQVLRDLPQSDAMLRLTLQLRVDAHDAEQFALEPGVKGPATVRFVRADATSVVYQQQGSIISRRVVRKDQSTHQEQFRCADKAEVVWSTDRNPPSMVSLQLKRNRGRSTATKDSSQVDRIDAALGLAVGGLK